MGEEATTIPALTTEPVSSDPLGRGRSATVFKVDGTRPLARKIFTGSRAADIVMTLFYGAPSEYRWYEPAVKAAHYRRRVLTPLVRHWFGERVKVANAVAWGLDEDAKAYYLDTELVEGHASRLYSPFLYGVKTEIYDLKDEIMPRLQKHLLDAGFIGTVWQAGMGQPCAYPNFLCTHHDMRAHQHHWAWIDLESGVPAIASYNVIRLFGFYIPQAWKRRRVLYDDLNEEQLHTYLAVHEDVLKESLGTKEYDKLLKDAASLTTAHSAWAKERRLSRSLKYFLFRGRITQEEYYHYEWHPSRWYGRLFLFLLARLIPKILRTLKEYGPRVLRLINPLRWIRFLVNLITSRTYRVEISRAFARYGIDDWLKAGRINAEQAEELARELGQKEANPYLSDFGVHLAMKPLGYILRFTIVPVVICYAPVVGGILFVFAGMILRMMYTVCRTVEDVIAKRPFPFIALLISPIPSLGTLAYPCQMIHSARQGHCISQFIIYESCSELARRIPIWGGRDGGWDHFFNRIAHAMIVMSN